MKALFAISTRRSIGIIGTVARVMFGIGFLALAWYIGIEWYSLLLGLLLLPAVVLLLQRQRLRRTTSQLQATGLLAHLLNVGFLIALFLFQITAAAAALFLGSSMLISAVRGYAGCEVTAISNWILRRNDQVGCLLFSPVDAIEARMHG